MRFRFEMTVEFVCLLVFDCFQFHVDSFSLFFSLFSPIQRTRFSFQCNAPFHFDLFAIFEIAIDCRDKHSLDRCMDDAKRCNSIEPIRVEKFIAIFL